MQLIRELRNTAPLGKVEWLIEMSTDDFRALGLNPTARPKDPSHEAATISLAIDSMLEEMAND